MNRFLKANPFAKVLRPNQNIFERFKIKSKKANDDINSGPAPWKDRIKLILSKISGSFMLPISAMALGGLFLGIGAAIQSNAGSNIHLNLFGGFIKSLGDPIFGALPLLFAAAFVVAFTEDAGVAVFATVIAFLVFNAIQAVFITPVDSSTYSLVSNNSTDVAGKGNVYSTTYITSLITNNKFPDSNFSFSGHQYRVIANSNNEKMVQVMNSSGSFVDAGKNGAVIKLSEFFKDLKSGVDVSGFIKNDSSTSSSSTETSTYFLRTLSNGGYSVLFEGGGRTPQALRSLVGSNLGITSLSTSIFGGIAVGLIMAKLYNKFHTIKLPAMISFFGGKRFVALVGIVAMIPLAVLFLILWPYIGIVLNLFGNAIGKIPYGFESFIFGYVERSLIPFGLHHVFYAPLWYTSAGGDAIFELNKFLGPNNSLNELTGPSANLLQLMQSNPDAWKGDSFTSVQVVGLPYNTISWKHKADNSMHNLPVFTFFANNLNLKIGRFLQGKYPFMQWGLPAAAAAMVFAAPKENRKIALGSVVPSAFTSFLTGVTEPIEFTFLFLSPFLFWGFHSFMAALSFLLMNVLGAHIAMTFSGGFIDMIIYGFVPVRKGTMFWWWAVIGAVYAPIYFFFFWWWIKFRNLATPGRGGNVKLFTKADYKARQNEKQFVQTSTGSVAVNVSNSFAANIDQESASFFEAFGGAKNIKNFSNCASRLRYDVHDRSKVSDAKLKQAGAIAVMWIGNNHVQVIIGARAESLNTKLKAASKH